MTLLFFLQKCVKDTLSPITVKLSFSQNDSESASAVLNVDSKRQAVIEVCKAEDILVWIFFFCILHTIRHWDVKWNSVLRM